MFRTLISAALVLAIAFGLGGVSVRWAIDEGAETGRLRTGAWTAFPDAGSADADPYSRARFLIDPSAPLGATEGVTFRASDDSEGDRLETACDYRLVGEVPSARFWTLYATDRDNRPIQSDGRPWRLHSDYLMRQPDGSVVIEVSGEASSGNWLALSGDQPAVLVLTLYDAAISASNSIFDIDLPRIERVGCDD